MPSLVVGGVSLAIALLAALVGILPEVLFWPPLALGSLLVLVFAFDVVTVKWDFRPKEALPRRRDDLDAFDLMRSRVSCRSYQSRNLTDAHRNELLDSVRRHTGPGRLLGRGRVRFEFVAAPLTVWPVVGAHEFLVAIAPREYDRLSVIDVGRCLQKVVMDATRMGLGTCWIGPGANHESVEGHLGERFDPNRDHIICVCAVGYASWFKPLLIRLMPLQMHRRLPLGSLFFEGPSCQLPLHTEREPFARFGRCYEVCQWSPSSYNGQTTRCAAIVERSAGKERVLRFDFCAATASRYYAAVALGIWLANWEMGCEALGIRGRFEVLSPEQRQVKDTPELPRYDVSFIPEEPGTGEHS
jgi:nitroreductase